MFSAKHFAILSWASMDAVFHQHRTIDDHVENPFGALNEARRAFTKIVDPFRFGLIDSVGIEDKYVGGHTAAK